MSKVRPASIAELLSRCAPDLRRMVEASRTHIMQAVPSAIEKYRAGWGLIGYNAPAYFAFIDVSRGHTRIGFEWGTLLADPKHLLRGEGSQVRYFAVETSADLNEPLTDLLREAAMFERPTRRRRSR